MIFSQLLTSFYKSEHSRVTLWVPVLMTAGVATYFTLPTEPPDWCLVLSLFLIVGVVVLHRVWWRGAVILGVIALVSVGFTAAQIETRLDARPMLNREIGPVTIDGLLVMSEPMPDGVRLTLKYPMIGHMPADHTPEAVRIRFDGMTLSDLPPPGTRLSFLGRVGPFSEPVAPGATDFQRLAYFRHLGGLGWAYGGISITDPSPHLGWRDRLIVAGEQARQTLAKHVNAELSGDVAAMTSARLNGEQTGISKPVIESMRIAGLAHLLSTSGFHVTIMGLLVYFPLRAILAAIPFIALRFPIKKYAAMGAILSASGYTFLVGAPAATLRSLVMTGVAMLAILVDRRAQPMRLVMLSAALVTLIAPDALMGPSFQMSFAAVFCLIAAYQGKRSEDPFGLDFLPGPDVFRKSMSHLLVIARTSLIATAATTPFAVYHFQTFSFYGFIANMLAIPMTSFWVMPCILLAYLGVPFGVDGFFIRGAGYGIGLTIKVATLVASWPWSIFYLPQMPGWILVIITLGGLWLCIWRHRLRWLGLLPILIGMVYPFYIQPPDMFISPDGREWALRLEDGRLAVSNLDRDAFEVQQWQERLGHPDTVDVTELPEASSPVRCDTMGCVVRRGRHMIALPERDEGLLEDCQQASVIITPALVRDCHAALVIDGESLWQYGAHSLRFKGDMIAVTIAREAHGARPWQADFKPATTMSTTPVEEVPAN